MGLQFGAAEPSENGRRLPVYLYARQAISLAGLSYSIGAESAQALEFVSAGDALPTIIDNMTPGVLAVAWLDGLRLGAGERVLLGWVRGPAVAAGGALRVYGAVADRADGGQPVRLTFSSGIRLPQLQ